MDDATDMGAKRLRLRMTAMLVLSMLLASLAIRDPVFRNTLRYSLQGLGLAFSVLPLVNAPQLGWANRILEWAPLRWMGRRSYGAYLWHYAALSFTAAMLGVNGALETAPVHDRLAATPITLVLTWLFAALSYVLVFKPSQRLKPLLTPRPRGAAAPLPVGGEPAAS